MVMWDERGCEHGTVGGTLRGRLWRDEAWLYLFLKFPLMLSRRC